MADTYIYVRDDSGTTTAPEGDSFIGPFQVYNEAMSYARYLSTNWMQAASYVNIWNHDGGSGYWKAGSWTAQENTNYP